MTLDETIVPRPFYMDYVGLRIWIDRRMVSIHMKYFLCYAFLKKPTYTIVIDIRK